jgi:predicted TIM-barrel fold metal-dependent hydrolase
MTTRRSLGLAALSFAATPARAAPTHRVDCHTHSFVPGLPRAADARYAPDHDASYDRLLALAEANGIGRVVITQPSFLGHDNSCLFEALRARPDRLRRAPAAAGGAAGHARQRG